MIYVISDIHGCFEEFKSLLKQIHFSSSDELYLLGDFIDRGPEPIKLIQFIMLYPNIYPILGNHEYMAMKILSKLDLEITENTVDILTTNDIQGYLYWMQESRQQISFENWIKKTEKIFLIISMNAVCMKIYIEMETGLFWFMQVLIILMKINHCIFMNQKILSLSDRIMKKGIFQMNIHIC